MCIATGGNKLWLLSHNDNISSLSSAFTVFLVLPFIISDNIVQLFLSPFCEWENRLWEDTCVLWVHSPSRWQGHAWTPGLSKFKTFALSSNPCCLNLAIKSTGSLIIIWELNYWQRLIPEMCIFGPIVFLSSATVMFAFVCSCTAPYVAVGNLVMALLDHLSGRWAMKSTEIFSSWIYMEGKINETHVM